MFFFFFSSRRRHTRWPRDWSSDVCSSDLIEVPTVHGNVMLKIPAGTQTDKVFRLKGKGAPNVRGYGHGDQHVQVKVITPTKLTDKQKELLREFNEIGGNEATDEQGDSFFQRFKKAFKGE